MATIAVVDAQIKNQIATDELIKRSPWWKRLKKRENG
jgi:malate dehydrogenase (oxaloacetate-decarboxylating)(NADP+)